ncbi:MAG: hypothetical protein ACYTG5_04975 [Planctomycetota bacterium]|jgi:type II secretory pathway pseudopilin PulG
MKQDGFAMLALIIAVAAAGAAGLAIFGNKFSRPVEVEHLASVADRLSLTREAAQQVYQQSGSFPANLGALAIAIGLDSAGEWRLDPFGGGSDLDYQVSGVPANLVIRSRGPDGALGTGDDRSIQLSEQIPGRARTRGHLRLLRARFFNSSLMDDPGMAPVERMALRTHMSNYAIAQRQLLFAAPSDKPALIAARDLAAAQIQAIRSSHGLPPIPSSSTGPGGLCEALGIPDALGTDGFGSLLLTGEVGFISAGGDRTGGTDDDL